MRLTDLLLRRFNKFSAYSKFSKYNNPFTAKNRSKRIVVPHKQPPNKECELHWKFARHVCQLKRLTINYCPHSARSRGVRTYLDYEAHTFVAANPQIAIYVYEIEYKPPNLTADYLNGKRRVIQIPNHDNQAIVEWMIRLRDDSGRMWSQERLHKPWISTQPSIQGVWTPFMFKPPVDINPENYIVKSEDNNMKITENNDLKDTQMKEDNVK